MIIEQDRVDYIGILSHIFKEQGITQVQMSRDIGVSKNTVSRWMVGETVPTVESFEKVLNKYGYVLTVRKDTKTKREIRKELTQAERSLQEKVRIARELGISYGELDARLRGTP